ncbi:AlbA family DNA-binding domain-containing protein [Deinococcus aestuarii]|uniref:AlbA family DNA-binding domain-containing protein n=1 Tax=Deinococcus aestuarii TaxID=2774531 RepID=UPI001FE878CB|nr:ATP-binding protein [Deinococcus aestuarii]
MNREDLLALLQWPESVDLEYKRTFPPGFFEPKSEQYDDARAEVIKDVAALTNAISPQPGHLVYGIADHQGRRVVHRERRAHPVDDAQLRQFFARFLDPVPHFAYGEFEHEGQLVGLLRVLRIPPSPHVIKTRVGRSTTVAPGQVWVRRGTSNTVALLPDLKAIFQGDEAFPIEVGSEEERDLAAQHQAEGYAGAWVSASLVESRLRRGYELVYWPGTRRRVRRVSQFVEPEPTYMMKRRQ